MYFPIGIGPYDKIVQLLISPWIVFLAVMAEIVIVRDFHYTWIIFYPLLQMHRLWFLRALLLQKELQMASFAT